MEVTLEQLFQGNLVRLMGVHNLNNRKLCAVLDVDPATVSFWVTGRRRPGVQHMIELEELFGVSVRQLAATDIYELLPVIADPERFRATEIRIRRGLTGLKSV